VHQWCAACHIHTMRDRQDEGRRGKRGIWRDLGGTKDGVRDTCALLSPAVLKLVPRLGFAESDSAHNPPHHTARQRAQQTDITENRRERERKRTSVVGEGER